MPNPEKTQSAVQTEPAQTSVGGRGGLAGKVKRLRRERELTLEELSASSGLAISTLSRIENGRLSPTYEAILALATGLNVDVEQLFTEPTGTEPAGRRSITRKGQGLKHKTKAYDYEMLCTDVSRKKLTPILARVKSHSIEDFGHLLAHNGEELIYVLEGSIQLLTDYYEPVTLSKGDCVYFDSTMGHACLAYGVEDAYILWVCSDSGSVNLMEHR